MPDHFRIVDVSGWQVDRSEDMGSKAKDWRLNPDGDGRERWLYKLCRMIPDFGYAGEDWAEKIACEIAALLGMPHARVELAVRDGEAGVISADFVSDRLRFKLTHGNELMVQASPDYPTNQKRRLSLHTVDNVMGVLSQDFIHLPGDWAAPDGVETPCDLFVGYLMLDALIGNVDRHHENWAIIERQGGKDEPRYAEIAPTFDHASSLSRELTDASRDAGLTGAKPSVSPDTYAAKTRSALYEQVGDERPVSPVDAFRLAANKCRPAGQAWLNRLAELPDEAVVQIVEAVPVERLSPIGRDYALGLLRLNRKAMLEVQL